MSDPRLHVHALDHEHGDVMLRGNRAGLERLQAQIDHALERGLSMAGAPDTSYLPSDGEWFDVWILLRDREESWNVPTPYYEKRSW